MWIYKIFWAGKVQIFDSYFVKKMLLKELQWRVKKNINNKSKNKDAVKDSNIGNIIGFPAISYIQYNSYLI